MNLSRTKGVKERGWSLWKISSWLRKKNMWWKREYLGSPGLNGGKLFQTRLFITSHENLTVSILSMLYYGVIYVLMLVWVSGTAAGAIQKRNGKQCEVQLILYKIALTEGEYTDVWQLYSFEITFFIVFCLVKC